MERNKPTKVIGYVLKKFPVLSETFILNEILALEACGILVHIFSLERPNDPRFHDDLPKLKANISYVPDLIDIKSLMKHRSKAAQHFGKDYTRALTYVIKHMKPGLFQRFLQSCYVADRARKFGISHFHAHFATRPTSVAFLSSMISNIPYSFTAHAMDIYKVYLSPKALAKKIKRAEFVVTVSEYNKTFLERVVNGEYKKIFIVYNGINLKRFNPNGWSPNNPFTLICVARFVEKKGHTILIKACALLRDRGVQFKCMLVGKGKLRLEIEKIIKKYKLKDYVHILGAHSQVEVLKRYHSAHLYVLPCIIGGDGNRDGLPVSIVEALACGLPVVTTPMTGIPEVVRDKYNGLLVPSDNVEALADAIESTVCDSDLYESLRSNTRVSVESKFDLDQTVMTLQKLFLGN